MHILDDILSQIKQIFETKISKNLFAFRELQGFFCRPPLAFLGEGRDSNPQPSEPQSDALPIVLPSPYCLGSGIRTHEHVRPKHARIAICGTPR